MRSDVARQEAQAERLTLLRAENKTGYFGVCLNNPGKPKPYLAQVRRGGKLVYLGNFATAEETALCVARSPEGRKAAERVVSAAAPLRSEEEEGQGNPSAMPSRAVLKEKVGTVPPMPVGASVKEGEVPSMPPGAFFKEGVVVNREHEVVADEGGRSEGRPKRRKNQ